MCTAKSSFGAVLCDLMSTSLYKYTFFKPYPAEISRITPDMPSKFYLFYLKDPALVPAHATAKRMLLYRGEVDN
jgi:hypothetical protein